MAFFQNLTGWHALILLAIVLLLFGAAKLPALARSAGQSMRIFRSEIKDPDAAETAPAPSADSVPAPSPGSVPAATTTVPVPDHPSGREVVALAERSASS